MASKTPAAKTPARKAPAKATEAVKAPDIGRVDADTLTALMRAVHGDPFAVLGMLCDARRCKVLGGYALLLGALVWALLAMGFVAAYPPVNTAMFVYTAISVMCFLSGEHVMYTVRQEDAANDKKQGDAAACGQTP